MSQKRSRDAYADREFYDTGVVVLSLLVCRISEQRPRSLIPYVRHYKLGLEQGWIPRDPRTAAGTCARFGVGGDAFGGAFPASATGGVSLVLQILKNTGR